MWLSSTVLVLPLECFQLPRLTTNLLVNVVNMRTGDAFEVYVDLGLDEPKPAAKGADSRRRPRTPGKTKPNQIVCACGASPRPGTPSLFVDRQRMLSWFMRACSVSCPPSFARVLKLAHKSLVANAALSGAEAKELTPTQEPDHEAAIIEFLDQRRAREHEPQHSVVVETERPKPPKLSDSLTLSPAVQQPSRRRTFDLSEAVSAGLSGLESSSMDGFAVEMENPRGLNQRTPVASHPQRLPAPASFNATARMNATVSSQSPQWLPPTSSAASVATAGWGFTPTPSAAKESGSIGESLGAAWGSRRVASHPSPLPEADLTAIDAAFKPRSAGIIGGVSSNMTPANGVRRFAAPSSRQRERHRVDGPTQTSVAPGLSPNSRGRRAARKEHPNSYMTDADRERMHRRLEAEKRSREQHFQVYGGSR